ncbi:MAG: M67 family metallopeptidase [Anaerolineaceae bacterium]|jgi:proteasome lid subunit RPN8/RPN11
MPEKLFLKAEMIEIMRAHFLRCIPEEACGILGGSGDHVKFVLPITNELHSPVKFRMAPEEQFKAFTWLEENSLQMLGYYHSHPSGPAYPSETDLLQFSYPGVVLVLLSLEDSTLQIKGFIIKENAINEVNLENYIS